MCPSGTSHYHYIHELQIILGGVRPRWFSSGYIKNHQIRALLKWESKLSFTSGDSAWSSFNFATSELVRPRSWALISGLFWWPKISPVSFQGTDFLIRKNEKALQYLLRECLIEWHTKNKSICEYKSSKLFLFSGCLLIFVGQTVPSSRNCNVPSCQPAKYFPPRVWEWCSSDVFS